jgi:hypothetical protein
MRETKPLLQFVGMPPIQSRLRINGELAIGFYKRMPNPWCRFWQWALCGFTWEDLRK